MSQARSLGMLLSGDAIDVHTFHNKPILDQNYLLLVNAHHEPNPFTLPSRESVPCAAILDTADEDGFLREPKIHTAGEQFELAAHSLSLLQLATVTGNAAS